MAVLERTASALPQPGLLVWLTSVDHKRIGKLYLTSSFVFFLLGGMLAQSMRLELAVPGLQLTDAEGYAQLFTMHGTIMMLLFATLTMCVDVATESTVALLLPVAVTVGGVVALLTVDRYPRLGLPRRFPADLAAFTA